MVAIESFSADYGEARTKFVAAATAQGGALQRIAHPARGPDGGDLSMDVAWFGDRSANKVLVTFSGVHGVEGFFGSGVQIEWLRRGENRRLPKDTAALLVHAINPYGFAWLRRPNEDNIDLNRNWIDFDRPLPTNVRYEEIAADLCPPDISGAAQAAAGARLASWRERNGERVFMQAVMGGQWRHADGLSYGGIAPSWSRKVLTDVLMSHLSGAARIAIVDFHTGLGPHGYAEPIIHRRRDDPGFARTRSWIGAAATSLYGGGSVSAEIFGDGLSTIQAMFPKAAVDAVALECGVLPPDKVGAALRADNRLHAHGDPTAPDAAVIKKLIREAFHSDSPTWQGMALGQGLAACRAALAGLALPLN
ncbi:MAG: M14 family metallopeptidase [Bradyrhizobium sp.]